MEIKDQERLKRTTKMIKNWIIQLVATYVAFIVLVNFLHISKPTGAFLISAGIAIPIFALLFYNIIILLQIKKRLPKPDNEQKPKE